MSKSVQEKLIEAGKHSVIYGLSEVVQKGLSFFLIPLYTKYYTVSMYGTMGLLNTIGVIAGSVFYFGLHSALSRSYYEYEEEYEKAKVVTTTFVLLLVGAILQIALGFLLSERLSLRLFNSDQYSKHINIVLIYTALNFISSLFFLLLRFERKSTVVSLFNIFKVITTVPLILIFLIRLNYGIMAPIIANLIVSIVVFIALLIITRKNYVFKINKKEIRTQLSWGGWVVISNFGVLSLNWFDRFFINKYSSSSELGIYTMGYTIGMLINIGLVIPFSQIWSPMRMEYRNDENSIEFYKKISTYYITLGLFMTSVISIFSKDILMILTSKSDYIEAYRVIPWIAFTYFMVGFLNISNNGIIFEKKMKTSAVITWLGALINFVLNCIFIPKYGYMAAAYTTFTSYFFVVLTQTIISNKYCKQEYEVKRISICTVCTIVAIYVAYSLIQYSVIYRIIIFLCLTIIYYSLLSKTEKIIFKTVIQNKVTRRIKNA